MVECAIPWSDLAAFLCSLSPPSMFKDNFLKNLPPCSRLLCLLFWTPGRSGPVWVGFLSPLSSRRLTAGLQKSEVGAIDGVYAPDVFRACLCWVCR